MQRFPIIQHLFAWFSLVWLVVSLSSCSLFEQPDFSDEILEIVSREEIDSLRSLGVAVHEGNTPPSIEGSFRVSPYEMLVPYADDDPYTAGQVISDYLYRFYDQDQEAKTITLDYRNVSGLDSGSGAGGYVSGKDDSFTIFSEDEGNLGTATYQTATIYSGRIVEGGIADFQVAFLVTEKNDPDNQLIPVGTGRVWFDNDFFSEAEEDFRRRAPRPDQPGSLTSLLLK